MRNAHGGTVTVTRDRNEPVQWTVRYWGRAALSYKIVSTAIFVERTEAVAFAHRLQRDHGAGDMIVRHGR